MRILIRVRRRDCVPSVELRRRLCLTSIAALLVQRRLRWFGHATRRPDGELNKDPLLPTLPRTLRRRIGGHLKKLSYIACFLAAVNMIFRVPERPRVSCVY